MLTVTIFQSSTTLHKNECLDCRFNLFLQDGSLELYHPYAFSADELKQYTPAFLEEIVKRETVKAIDEFNILISPDPVITKTESIEGLQIDVSGKDPVIIKEKP